MFIRKRIFSFIRLLARFDNWYWLDGAISQISLDQSENELIAPSCNPILRDINLHDNCTNTCSENALGCILNCGDNVECNSDCLRDEITCVNGKLKCYGPGKLWRVNRLIKYSYPGLRARHPSDFSDLSCLSGHKKDTV